MMDVLDQVVLSLGYDKYRWVHDPSDLFTVKSTRDRIDDVTLPSSTVGTRWDTSLPIKE